MTMGKKFNYTRTQWVILGALCSSMVGCALRKSFQAPLFPREANSKGSSASIYGLVFGIYEVVCFIVCPIFGKYIGKIGARKMLNGGLFLTAFSSICFGLLNLIESHVNFITLAFLVRILEAFGASAIFTSTYAIVGVFCKDSLAPAVAVLKMFMSFGFVIGPLLAGYTFQLGGFMTSFTTLGCILLLQALLVCTFFPEVDQCKNRSENQVQIMSVLKIIPVTLTFVCMAAAALSLGFFATLEPHLRQFDISVISVGAVFTVFPAATAVASPLVGYLCDRKVNPKTFLILGSVFIIAGYSLVGPAPYMPLNSTLWLVCLGLMIHGVGFACIFVASFSEAVHSAVASGIPNNMGLTGLVSGLSQASFALGDAIGPSVAGLLYDQVGFRHGTLFAITVHAVMVVVMICYINLARQPARNSEEKVDHLTGRWQDREEANPLSAEDVGLATPESAAMVPHANVNNRINA